jgi:hypothetical protein
VDRPAEEATELVNEIYSNEHDSEVASFLLEVRNGAPRLNELFASLNEVLAASGFDITMTPTEMRGAEAAANDQVLSGAAATIRAVVEGAKVEDAWGVKRQTVDAARQRGEIFSLSVKNQHW